jgi:hypothetical protein
LHYYDLNKTNQQAFNTQHKGNQAMTKKFTQETLRSVYQEGRTILKSNKKLYEVRWSRNIGLFGEYYLSPLSNYENFTGKGQFVFVTPESL